MDLHETLSTSIPTPLHSTPLAPPCPLPDLLHFFAPSYLPDTLYLLELSLRVLEGEAMGRLHGLGPDAREGEAPAGQSTGGRHAVLRSLRQLVLEVLHIETCQEAKDI